MKHFNDVVASIRWTPDYPAPGVDFADLSRTFGHPALAALAKTVVASLCMEKGQLILGVPTRGIVFSTVLANASGVQAVFLQKAGVGTPLPGSQPLASASTVYSGDKKTQFLLGPGDADRLQAADIVWVADDVCESGTTLATIRDALSGLGCKDVRLVALLTFAAKVRPMSHLYSVIERDSTGLCYPGPSVFTRPEQLFTLRGPLTGFMNRVYGPPSMTSLVLDFARSTDTVVGDICWDHFEGGLPNVTFEMPPSHVTFIYDAQWMNTVQDGVVHALARNCVGDMRVIIPFLGAGTCERTDREGVLATAQTALFSLCANMPLTKKGPVQVVVYDIHATAARFYTTDRVQYVSRQVLQTLVPDDVDVIAFPDGGALSRFRHLFTGRTLLVFSKVRQDGQRKICLSEKVGPRDVQGSTVFVVDDLVRTGGTILETAKILRSMGAARVGAAIVHADFDPGKTIAFVRNPLVDVIVTTDSIPSKARALERAGPGKVQIESLFRKSASGEFAAGDDKCLVLASESETKLKAVRRCLGSSTKSYAGIFVGPVPSRVPEQPIGSAEGCEGVRNRRAFVKKLFPHDAVVALESAVVQNGERYMDVAYALVDDCPQLCLGPWVPHGIQVSHEGPTVGEQLQKLHNLPSKDAWIEFLSDTDRVTQLEHALRQCLQ